MILTVCLSPCTDITIELDSLNVGKTNIVKSKTLSFTGKALQRCDRGGAAGRRAVRDGADVQRKRLYV